MADFDWNLYLKLAESLAGTHEEAYYRSAISRSYYSAFNLARSYLKTKKRDYSMRDHERLWSQMSAVSGEPKIQTFGNRVKEVRHRADYDFECTDLKADLRFALMNTYEIVKLIAGLDTEPNPIAIGSLAPPSK